MTWRERYKEKLITAEEAAKLVKSGDIVAFPMWDQPKDIMLALAARYSELRNVTLQGWWTSHYPWLDPGMEGSFQVQDPFVFKDYTRQGVRDRRIDWVPFIPGVGSDESRRLVDAARGRFILNADVFMCKVTPPKEDGFCCLGRYRWDTPSAIRTAKTVIAEVDPSLIWTYGDWIHISELDYLAEAPQEEYLVPSILPTPPEDEARIAQVIGAHIADLVRDGDTIQVGTGSASEAVLEFLNDKNELGLDTEILIMPEIELIKAGVITDKRKNIDRGKHVASALFLYSGDPRNPAALDLVRENPDFEFWGTWRMENIPRIASIDNHVAINNALAIDLLGQVVVDHLGPVPIAGIGGHIEFHIGCQYSRGGRSITALMSTAKGGTVSRIVPQLEMGTVVEVPCGYVDYLVTEHGTVNLANRGRRDRAEAIISVAHPDFQPELKRAARKLFYP